MRVSTLCFLFLSSASLLAAPPVVPKSDVPVDPSAAVTLTVAKQVTVAVGKKCVIVAETTAKKVTWRVPAGVDAIPADGRHLHVWAEPGTYTLLAAVPNGDDVLTQEIILTVTGARPPPTKLELRSSAQVGQIPFTVTFTASGDSTDGTLDFGDGTSTKTLPAAHVYVTAGDYKATLKTPAESASLAITATAGPPTPQPVTTPWATPTDGLRVLIVEEAANRSRLPATQLNILFSQTLRDHLNAVTPLGPDGKQHEWYILNQNDDTSGVAKYWGEGVALRKATPWIVISNGKTGTSEALPNTVEATLALIKKYEVPK